MDSSNMGYLQKEIMNALVCKGPMTLSQLTVALPLRQKEQSLAIALQQLKDQSAIAQSGPSSRHWMTREDRAYFHAYYLTESRQSRNLLKAKKKAFERLLNDHYETSTNER